MRQKCRTCAYRSTSPKINSCDYILIERHRRPCPPGDECTAYINRNSPEGREKVPVKKDWNKTIYEPKSPEPPAPPKPKKKYKDNRHQEAIAKGLCTACRKAPAENGIRWCAACAEKKRRQARERNLRKKLAAQAQEGETT